MKSKKIIIILIIVFVVLFYVFVFIKLSNKKDIKTVTNETTYYSIQNNINYFLQNYNEERLLNMLDDTYLIENNINKNNVLKMTSDNYSNPSFTAKSIKYYKLDNIYYYFVNGYIVDTIYNSSGNNDNSIYNSYEYYKNKNYLLITNNSKFIIRPLDDNINIDEYIKNFNNEIKVLNKGEVFENTSTSEKNKLTTYLLEFRDLLYIDSERAYNMLSNNTRIKYNNVDSIYNYINSSVDSYNKYKEKNEYVYNIVLENGNKIKITEKNIMDYILDF